MILPDQADEHRQLQERYAELSDARLMEMYEEIDDYTETAQQALRSEVARRGLDRPQPLAEEHASEPKRTAQWAVTDGINTPPACAYEGGAIPGLGRPLHVWPDVSELDPATHGVDPTAFDLVGAWIVGSLEEARKVMEILEKVGVKAYLGPDNVATADEYKGNFEDGVEIKVMKFQRAFVISGLRRYLVPLAEAAQPPEPEIDVLCPHCQSPDVLLEGYDETQEIPEEPSPDEKNHWRCDACGHQWEDDGLVGKS